ncbi:RNA polymerase sigma factor [Falsirhodobacter sp. 20TX0035]|uniref:RNA polymerase sigma factor n=1 Tax=Falsirhodobacter sp. 20TX0035 TaxID=3022019 RepID=UPI00232CE419|nr:RNA polymerase sigma factor [Falsirhodobacter sp. 20TX0035]MDB6452598.1 RNA polymerase sigma factor [Falsirhodobacter sp. 20TX0035]
MTDPFTETLIAFLPNLRRFALSLTQRADAADDLVQITAERALAGRHGYDPAIRMEAWLFRILRNAFIDQTRRDRVRGHSVDIHDMPEAAVIDGAAVTETALMLGAAQSALDRLPDDQRQVMLLVCVEELSYAEAAAILGIPVGTVMSRLSRARLAVAKTLGIS